jgi:hypothetical protein
MAFICSHSVLHSINANAAYAVFGLLFCIHILQDLLCQWFFDFNVSGKRFHYPVFGVDPEGMGSHSQSALQVPAFHPINTFS